MGIWKSPEGTLPSATARPLAEVATISPATGFAAIAKPARLPPAAVILARNCRRDIPSYAFAIQSLTISPSLLVISDQNNTNSLFGKLTILIKMGFGKEKKVSIITN